MGDMAKPRPCPHCVGGVIKNHKSKRCRKCFLKDPFKFGAHNIAKWSLGKTGDKHVRWKGGKWIYWRKQVLIRDDYTCRKCGLRDIEIMDVDHIKPKLDSSNKFKSETPDVNNLQTLCPNCHKRKTNQERKLYSGHLKPR